MGMSGGDKKGGASKKEPSMVNAGLPPGPTGKEAHCGERSCIRGKGAKLETDQTSAVQETKAKGSGGGKEGKKEGPTCGGDRGGVDTRTGQASGPCRHEKKSLLKRRRTGEGDCRGSTQHRTSFKEIGKKKNREKPQGSSLIITIEQGERGTVPHRSSKF